MQDYGLLRNDAV